jgi:hypothetical protein
VYTLLAVNCTNRCNISTEWYKIMKEQLLKPTPNRDEGELYRMNPIRSQRIHQSSCPICRVPILQKPAHRPLTINPKPQRSNGTSKTPTAMSSKPSNPSTKPRINHTLRPKGPLSAPKPRSNGVVQSHAERDRQARGELVFSTGDPGVKGRILGSRKIYSIKIS